MNGRGQPPITMACWSLEQCLFLLDPRPSARPTLSAPQKVPTLVGGDATVVDRMMGCSPTKSVPSAQAT
ncbi:MAG TPA: hypothetical protein PKD55_20620, partial [Bellilinea sp.]|nr:hypothetical protein [Bellilinea sp.]